MANVTGKWDGGYIVTDSNGRTTYYIRKQIGGKRYDVTTGAHSETTAHKQLVRFDAHPEAYDPRSDVKPDAIWLDDALSEAFLKHSKEEKHNTDQWVGEQQRQLVWWSAFHL